MHIFPDIIIRCIALSVLLWPAPLLAQEDSVAAAAAGYRSTLPPASFMMETVVQLRSGDTEAGYLMECDSALLFLRSPGGMTAVPMAEALRIAVPGRSKAMSVAVHGMLIGTYIGCLLALPQENVPGAYADAFSDDASPLLINTMMIAAVPWGLAYLIGLASDRNEEIFTFEGSEASQAGERERFERYLRPSLKTPRLHFTVEMAEVHPVEQARMDNMLEASGHPPETMYQSWEGYADSPFTFFRKLQMTYTAWPGVSLGAAYMDLAEPQSTDRSGTYYGDLTHILFLENRASAWYAVGTYEPLRGRLHRSVAWLFGAGVGSASLRGTFTATTTKGYYPEGTSVTHWQTLDRGLFSGLLFSDFRVYLYSSLSLALTGEFVYLPRIDIDAIDGLLPDGSRFDFSSWSWGIALGVHL